MKLPFLQNITVGRSHFIALLCVELFLLFRLCIPFWSNNLQTWDLMGHYYSAWFVHEHLFPNITGWNPTFFMGYEQGQFYPPLFSYLAALLGQVLPLESAFKILVIVGILATPLSFYVLARKWDFNPWSAVSITVVMLSLLFIISYETGVNFYATFNVGNINHGMSVPFLCFYLAFLPGALEQKRYLFISLLMTVIVLLHPFMSIVAAFFFVASVIVVVRAKKTFWTCLKHVGLTFLLSSFWILPFLLFERTEITPMILLRLSAAEVVVLTVVMTAYAIFERPHRIFSLRMRKTHVAFWALTLLIALLYIVSSFSYFEVPIRYHRFYMIYFLFAPILAFSLL
ncbi:MAG: hypothetical protein CMH60_05260 [Myxococcales bacterium]|nr:hypothetical protein [Myxococcales bacterium]